MFVGHLGELALSGSSMATSFASVTGFSLLVSINIYGFNPFNSLSQYLINLASFGFTLLNLCCISYLLWRVLHWIDDKDIRKNKWACFFFFFEKRTYEHVWFLFLKIILNNNF